MDANFTMSAYEVKDVGMHVAASRKWGEDFVESLKPRMPQYIHQNVNFIVTKLNEFQNEEKASGKKEIKQGNVSQVAPSVKGRSKAKKRKAKKPKPVQDSKSPKEQSESVQESDSEREFLSAQESWSSDEGSVGYQTANEGESVRQSEVTGSASVDLDAPEGWKIAGAKAPKSAQNFAKWFAFKHDRSPFPSDTTIRPAESMAQFLTEYCRRKGIASWKDFQEKIASPSPSSLIQGENKDDVRDLNTVSHALRHHGLSSVHTYENMGGCFFFGVGKSHESNLLGEEEAWKASIGIGDHINRHFAALGKPVPEEFRQSGEFQEAKSRRRLLLLKEKRGEELQPEVRQEEHQRITELMNELIETEPRSLLYRQFFGYYLQKEAQKPAEARKVYADGIQTVGAIEPNEAYQTKYLCGMYRGFKQITEATHVQRTDVDKSLLQVAQCADQPDRCRYAHNTFIESLGSSGQSAAQTRNAAQTQGRGWLPWR